MRVRLAALILILGLALSGCAALGTPGGAPAKVIGAASSRGP